MHAAPALHSPISHCQRFSPLYFSRGTRLSTAQPYLVERYASISCRGSRLQQLVPTIPLTEEPAELIAPISLNDHSFTTPDQIEQYEVDSAVQQTTDNAAAVVSAVDQQQQQQPDIVPSQAVLLQATPQQQQQQLQLYSSLAEDWTTSPDEEIHSAAADLSGASTPESGGFVGGRFTFGASSASQQQKGPAKLEQSDNQQVNTQADAMQQQLKSIEQELQQAVTISVVTTTTSSGSGSGSGSTSGGTYVHGVDSSVTNQYGGMQSSGRLAAAEVAAEEKVEEAAMPGSYFSSRGSMLQQLHHQQLQLHREYLLNKQRKNLYGYTLSDDGSIVRKSKPGPKHPLAQTSFALAKKQPVASDAADAAAGAAFVDTSRGSKEQTEAISSQSSPQQQQQGVGAPQQVPKQHRMQQMLPLQQHELLQPLSSATSSSSHSSYSSRTKVLNDTNTSAAATADDDSSRGLCLSVFLYCCSQSKLLTLTWQLGLPPNAMKFVSRVADADVVLHVKARPGEKHFHYDEYRDQAAKKGIPMVDLKSLSLQELQLYLLPLYKLYAGEISPRDLLRRQKPRGWKKRYTNIKLPKA